MAIARGGFHRRLRRLPSRTVCCLTTVVLTLGLAPGVASAAATNAAANNQKMLEFMNAERAARGLNPLSRDSRLDSLAQSWANKMAEARTMYHPSPPQAMTGAGYRSGAQNLAWHDNVLTGAWAHNFWMNSAPHRKNILDPAFTHVGLAMACNPAGGRYPYVFATVEFGGNSPPLSSVPPVSPHVAGSQSTPGAGCDGAADAPPPPPAAPAPVPAAPVAARVATPKAAPQVSFAGQSPGKSSPPASAAGKASPSPAPAKAATAPAAGKTDDASPAPPGPASAGGLSPTPGAAGTPSPAGRAERTEALAVAASRGESGSGPLIALVAGLSGILLMARTGSRRRRVRPKHAISRR